MSYMTDYYAAKDAERSDGSVDWDQVPLRHGGYKDTGHPDDVEWRVSRGGDGIGR